MAYIRPERPQPLQKQGDPDIEYELAPIFAASGAPTAGAVNEIIVTDSITDRCRATELDLLIDFLRAIGAGPILIPLERLKSH